MSERDTTTWLWKGVAPAGSGLSALSVEEIEALLKVLDSDVWSPAALAGKDKLRAELARRKGESE